MLKDDHHDKYYKTAFMVFTPEFTEVGIEALRNELNSTGNVF